MAKRTQKLLKFKKRSFKVLHLALKPVLEDLLIIYITSQIFINILVLSKFKPRFSNY